MPRTVLFVADFNDGMFLTSEEHGGVLVVFEGLLDPQTAADRVYMAAAGSIGPAVFESRLRDSFEETADAAGIPLELRKHIADVVTLPLVARTVSTRISVSEDGEFTFSDTVGEEVTVLQLDGLVGVELIDGVSVLR